MCCRLLLCRQCRSFVLQAVGLRRRWPQVAADCRPLAKRGEGRCPKMGAGAWHTRPEKAHRTGELRATRGQHSPRHRLMYAWGRVNGWRGQRRARALVHCRERQRRARALVHCLRKAAAHEGARALPMRQAKQRRTRALGHCQEKGRQSSGATGRWGTAGAHLDGCQRRATAVDGTKQVQLVKAFERDNRQTGRGTGNWLSAAC